MYKSIARATNDRVAKTSAITNQADTYVLIRRHIKIPPAIFSLEYLAKCQDKKALERGLLTWPANVGTKQWPQCTPLSTHWLKKYSFNGNPSTKMWAKTSSRSMVETNVVKMRIEYGRTHATHSQSLQNKPPWTWYVILASNIVVPKKMISADWFQRRHLS